MPSDFNHFAQHRTCLLPTSPVSNHALNKPSLEDASQLIPERFEALPYNHICLDNDLQRHIPMCKFRCPLQETLNFQIMTFKEQAWHLFISAGQSIVCSQSQIATNCQGCTTLPSANAICCQWGMLLSFSVSVLRFFHLYITDSVLALMSQYSYKYPDVLIWEGVSQASCQWHVC